MQKKKNLIQVRRKLLQVLFEYFSSSLLHDNFWACHCAPKIGIQCKISSKITEKIDIKFAI